MLPETYLWPFIIAGLMNGSFIIPSNYIKNLSNEKIWLYHSIIGITIIPWVLLLLMSHQLDRYLFLQPSTLLFLITSGIIFGTGQVCFAYAIQSIGIALSFTVNLGIGLTLGSMFVIFYKSAFFSTQGYLTTLAVFLVLCSLIAYYFAAKANNIRSNSYSDNNISYSTGWLLAIFAGFASGLQNITFTTVAVQTKSLFQASDPFWIWPPFLSASALPMVLGFLYKNKQRQVNPALINHQTFIKNIALITLMGLFFTGSLAIYGFGIDHLTQQQQVISWPAFMVSIILSAQFWGWLNKETRPVMIRDKIYMIFSVMLLIAAIFILAAAGR